MGLLCTFWPHMVESFRASAPKVTTRRWSEQVARFSSTSSVAKDQTQLMKDVLYRVRAVNYMPDDIRASLMEFQVDGQSLGKVRPSIAEQLCQAGDDIFVHAIDSKDRSVLTLGPKAGADCAARTAAVAVVTKQLRDNGVVTGWRDELYPIATCFYADPVFHMERAAVPLLGALEYGVHVNGVQADGRMWMARRSSTKSKFPSMLDHIVAGGQPSGISLMENVVKECKEEAGIPDELARAGIVPVGAISYETYSAAKDTISRAVLFNYDLTLPDDFVPTPVDGEVEEFFLWTVDEILESMAENFHDPIKPNCYSVIIDYLLRKGILSPDVPGYLDVVRELRSGDCR